MNSKETNSQVPMNYEAALETMAGEKAFLLELLNDYEAEYTSGHAALKKAIESADYETIEQGGHRLKGASSALFLEPLRQAAEEMELAGSQKDIQRAEAALAALEKEFARLLNFLKEKILPEGS